MMLGFENFDVTQEQMWSNAAHQWLAALCFKQKRMGSILALVGCGFSYVYLDATPSCVWRYAATTLFIGSYSL